MTDTIGNLDLDRTVKDGEPNSHRPQVRFSIDPQDLRRPVCMVVGALWGQNQRFVELTPLEARQMAKLLVDAAEAGDRLRAEVVADVNA